MPHDRVSRTPDHENPENPENPLRTTSGWFASEHYGCRTIQQEAQIIDLSKDHCQREIAEIMGMSKGTVLKVQHKYHLVLSFGRAHSSAQFNQAHQWDENEWGPILEELFGRQRLPIHEISARTGLTKHSVRQRLKVIGFGEEDLRGRAQVGMKKKWKYPKCQCGTMIMKKGERYCNKCRNYPSRRTRTPEHPGGLK